jgi:hypothetical protein|tara:strand:- start:239 stop:451 length:213 start_codon:yes stop_codon:yes gene_type:complete
MRLLGTYQGHALQEHYHGVWPISNQTAAGGLGSSLNTSGTQPSNTNKIVSGNSSEETRSVNTALLPTINL